MNIVDRLITYVEYRGVLEARQSLDSITHSLEYNADALKRLSVVQKLVIDTQNALTTAQNRSSLAHRLLSNSVSAIIPLQNRLTQVQKDATIAQNALTNAQRLANLPIPTTNKLGFALTPQQNALNAASWLNRQNLVIAAQDKLVAATEAVTVAQQNLNNIMATSTVLANNTVLAREAVTLATEAEAAATLELAAANELVNKTAANMKLLFIGIAAIIATVLVVAILKANAELEKMQAQISGLYRSSSEGVGAMGFLRGLSISSGPFSIGQNAEAYTRFLSEGVNPSRNNLLTAQAVGFTRNMSPGDVAAIAGRAALGNTRGLRQLGIGTDDIEHVNKALIDAKGHFKNFGEAVNVIMGLLKERYQGDIDTMEDLTVTKVSNLKNAWTEFMGVLGGAGFSRAFKGLLDVLTVFLVTLGVIVGGIKVALELAVSKIFNILGFFIPRFKKTAKAYMDYANETATYMGFIGGKKGVLPPWLQHMEEDASKGGSSHIIREVLGGGAIAKIGIRASELPGLGTRSNNTIKVQVSGAGDQDLKKWLEKLLGQFYNEAVKHNAFPQHS